MDEPCPLCFETDFPKRSFCKDALHAPICKLCIQSYCIHKIENSFIGTCPTMICPCQNQHKNNQIRLLDFPEWSNSNMISFEEVRKYRQLASSLLSFLCAGCHTLRYVSNLCTVLMYFLNIYFMSNTLLVDLCASEMCPRKSTTYRMRRFSNISKNLLILLTLLTAVPVPMTHHHSHHLYLNH